MITHTFTVVLYGNSPVTSIRGEIEDATSIPQAIGYAAELLAETGLECHRILLNVRVHKPSKSKSSIPNNQ